MNKTSLRFFGDIPVRSVWDDDTSKWWLCASDVVAALAETINPRIFWATIKRRNPQLFANCKQLKMIARDSKLYKTDVIDETQLNALIALVRSSKKELFINWLALIGSSIDEKSKTKAYELYESFGLIEKALTDKINDREIFIKGIDYSYYYESEE